MLGQWSLGEEALGEIDGPPAPPPLVAEANVWFAQQALAEVTFSTTEFVASVTLSIATIATVRVTAETSTTTVSI